MVFMMKKKTIIFDINLARKICKCPKHECGKIKTRNGHDVDIIAFDIKNPYPIVAIVHTSENYAAVHQYNLVGIEKHHSAGLTLCIEISNDALKCFLLPFDKVLVRNSIGEKWILKEFWRYTNDNKYRCLDETIWSYCIPYKTHQELLGTTTDCEDKY